jgi:hypothetical protein
MTLLMQPKLGELGHHRTGSKACRNKLAGVDVDRAVLTGVVDL